MQTPFDEEENNVFLASSNPPSSYERDIFEERPIKNFRVEN
jgi:hypothetical protein